jgi:hypothetical protein
MFTKGRNEFTLQFSSVVFINDSPTDLDPVGANSSRMSSKAYVVNANEMRAAKPVDWDMDHWITYISNISGCPVYYEGVWYHGVPARMYKLGGMYDSYDWLQDALRPQSEGAYSLALRERQGTTGMSTHPLYTTQITNGNSSYEVNTGIPPLLRPASQLNFFTVAAAILDTSSSLPITMQRVNQYRRAMRRQFEKFISRDYNTVYGALYDEGMFEMVPIETPFEFDTYLSTMLAEQAPDFVKLMQQDATWTHGTKNWLSPVAILDYGWQRHEVITDSGLRHGYRMVSVTTPGALRIKDERYHYGMGSIDAVMNSRVSGSKSLTGPIGAISRAEYHEREGSKPSGHMLAALSCSSAHFRWYLTELIHNTMTERSAYLISREQQGGAYHSSAEYMAGIELQRQALGKSQLVKQNITVAEFYLKAVTK